MEAVDLPAHPTTGAAELPTRFTERFGCRYPFAAAGMAFAGMTVDLAAAVCSAGGLGAIGVGMMAPADLRATIRELRRRTDGPFNINFITCFENDANVEVCVDEGVPIVSFHWGHPPEPPRTRGAPPAPASRSSSPRAGRRAGTTTADCRRWC